MWQPAPAIARRAPPARMADCWEPRHEHAPDTLDAAFRHRDGHQLNNGAPLRRMRTGADQGRRNARYLASGDALVVSPDHDRVPEMMPRYPMEKCAATVLGLQPSSPIHPSLSAEDCTTHQTSHRTRYLRDQNKGFEKQRDATTMRNSINLIQHISTQG